MHFFMSLMFLLQAMALSLVYFLVPIIIYLGCRRLWQRFRAENGLEFAPFYKYFVGKISLFCLVVFVAFHSIIYIGALRSYWNDNVHKEAKPYYAVGHVVYGQRILLTSFMHPENKLLAPFNSLQQKIFAKGSQYLPKDDGEIGVWTYEWFIAPYVKSNARTKDAWRFRGGESPNFTALLEKLWGTIETVSLHPFRDKDMEAKYLQHYPSMVFYYGTHKSFLVPHKEFREKVRTGTKHVARGEKLIGWIDALRLKWQADSWVNSLISKKNMFFLDAIYLFESENLLLTQLYMNEFSCECPYTDTFLKARQIVIDTKIRGEDMQRVYKTCLSSSGARFYKYILEEYCDIEVPGRLNSSYALRVSKKYGKRTADDIDDKTMQSDFYKEFKILQELGYGEE